MAPRPEWLNAALEHAARRPVRRNRADCNAVLGANPAEADALHLLA